MGDDILNGRERFKCKGHIIHKDREYDAHITYRHLIDGSITIALLKPKRLVGIPCSNL